MSRSVSVVFGIQVALMLAILGTPSQARGQDNPCSSVIKKATRQYRRGNFDSTIQRLYECMTSGSMRSENVVDVHRLLALSYLKKNDLKNARRTIVRLLSKVPDYKPDAIQDPPSYVALVQNVSQQLAVQTETPAASESTEGSNAAHNFFVHLAGGFTSYGGERGHVTDNLVNELRKGAGLALELKGTYLFSSWIGGGVSYQAGRFPELIRKIEKAPFGPIDESTSSAWVHGVTLFGMVQFFPRSPVIPYIQVGGSSVYTLKNGTLQAGFGPQIGFGIKAPVSDKVAIFAEGLGSYIFSGDTLDLVALDHEYDLLSNFLLGVRYRIRSR